MRTGPARRNSIALYIDLGIQPAGSGVLISMKQCTTCHESKPFSEFNRKANTRDGLQSQCRICQRASNLKWVGENRETARASRMKHYASKAPDRDAKAKAREAERARRQLERQATVESEQAKRERRREERRRQKIDTQEAVRARVAEQRARDKLVRQQQGRPDRETLTVKQYADLWEYQHQQCAVCCCTEAEWHLDHNPQTHKVRGILCMECNSKRLPEVECYGRPGDVDLQAAILAYIESPPAGFLFRESEKS